MEHAGHLLVLYLWMRVVSLITSFDGNIAKLAVLNPCVIKIYSLTSLVPYRV